MTKTILVADDSKTIRHVVNLTFYATGFRVVAASSAHEAVQRLNEERPDLVLADVGMPGIDGYQLCEQLKHNASTAGIPVLLMTGAFEPFDEGRARVARADGHIRKPFDTQTLLDQVKALTGEKVEPAAAPLSFAATLAQRANGPTSSARIPVAPQAPQHQPPAPPPQASTSAPDIDDLMAPQHRAPPTPFSAPRRDVAPPVVQAPPPAPPQPVMQARDQWMAQQNKAPVWPEDDEITGETSQEEEEQLEARSSYGPSLEPPSPPDPEEEAHRRSVDVWALQDDRGEEEEPASGQDQSEPIDEIEIEDIPPDEEPPPRSAPTAPMSAAIAERAAPAIAAAVNVPGLSKDELLATAREVIERVAWEVVPELAETIIREEIRRLLKDR